MPTLEELRRWLAGEHTEGLPERTAVAPQKGAGVREPDSKYAGREEKRYKISADGKDALLKFGVHRGKSLSVLAVSEPSYVTWLLSQDFPEELKDVARYRQELWKKELAGKLK